MSEAPLLAPLRRRWYIVVAGLLVTGYLAYSMSLGIAPTYTSTTSVLLMPGKKTMPVGGNPFQHLGDLTQARDVLVQSLSTRSATDEVLKGAGAVTGSTVAVTADMTTMGPVILLTASAPTSQGATDLAEALLQALNDRLQSFQDESATPAGSRISALQISKDENAESGGRQAFRILIVLMVVGAVATLLLTAVVDTAIRWAKSRSRSKEGHPEPVSEAPSGEAAQIGVDTAGPDSEGRSTPDPPEGSASPDVEHAVDDWNVRT